MNTLERLLFGRPWRVPAFLFVAVVLAFVVGLIWPGPSPQQLRADSAPRVWDRQACSQAFHDAIDRAMARGDDGTDAFRRVSERFSRTHPACKRQLFGYYN